jgi:hypothetical protein
MEVNAADRRMWEFDILLVLEGGAAGASLDAAEKTDAGGGRGLVAAAGGDSWASSPGT